MIYIEAYLFRRATGASYISTPKNLANTKCTINPDNSKIIDPKTGKPADNCLQDALGYHFAYLNRYKVHLEHIFTAEKLKPYLDKVNLNGIPMPTPICPKRLKIKTLQYILMYGNGKRKHLHLRQ